MGKKIPPNTEKTRKRAVSAEHLRELQERCEWALEKLGPMIAALDTKPPKMIEAEGRIMSDRGWKNIKSFILNCHNALSP